MPTATSPTCGSSPRGPKRNTARTDPVRGPSGQRTWFAGGGRPTESDRRRSAAPIRTLHLVLDVLLGDFPPPIDVPGVHHQADAPRGNEERGPEEASRACERPDQHHEPVDQQIYEKVRVKVALFLQSLHCLVPRRLLTSVDSHGNHPLHAPGSALRPDSATGSRPRPEGLTTYTSTRRRGAGGPVPGNDLAV